MKDSTALSQVLIAVVALAIGFLFGKLAPQEGAAVDQPAPERSEAASPDPPAVTPVPAAPLEAQSPPPLSTAAPTRLSDAESGASSLNELENTGASLKRVAIILNLIAATDQSNAVENAKAAFDSYKQGKLRPAELLLVMEGLGGVFGKGLVDSGMMPKLPKDARMAVLKGWALKQDPELHDIAGDADLIKSLGLRDFDVFSAIAYGALESDDPNQAVADVQSVFTEDMFTSALAVQQTERRIFADGFGGAFRDLEETKVVTGPLANPDIGTSAKEWTLFERAEDVGAEAIATLLEDSPQADQADVNFVVSGTRRLAKLDLDQALEFARSSEPAVRPYALNAYVQELGTSNPDAAIKFIAGYDGASVHEQMNLLSGLETATQHSDPDVAQQCRDLSRQLASKLQEELQRGDNSRD